MSDDGSEHELSAAPPTVRGAAVYAGATGVALALAVASFLVEPTVAGGLAFSVLACAGVVATRLVWRRRVPWLLNPVSTWAIASLINAWGWGLLLTGGLRGSWLFAGGLVLGGVLIGTLRCWTSRCLWSLAPNTLTH